MLFRSRALPQLSALLSHMGLDALTGEQESMKLPFTGPRSIFNTKMDSSRQVVICDLSLKQVRKLAQRAGGTINDVLLAVCGGSLRQYLLGQDALPGRSLVAGVPVSLKSSDEDEGNRLSFILCPFFTTEKDDYTRLQRVIKTTRKAKAELGKMSTTANQDFTNLILIPTILLTLTGNATRVTPAINAYLSLRATGRILLQEARILSQLWRPPYGRDSRLSLGRGISRCAIASVGDQFSVSSTVPVRCSPAGNG